MLIALAYEKVAHQGETSWDFAEDCLVTHSPPGILNMVTGVVGLAAMLLIEGIREGAVPRDKVIAMLIIFAGVGVVKRYSRGDETVMRAAADTLKRVHLELGGKAANIAATSSSRAGAKRSPMTAPRSGFATK